MLPGLYGYEVLSGCAPAATGRRSSCSSAKDGEYDLADALDLGADDYLVKPFSYVVLVARLRALLRRRGTLRPPVLTARGPGPRHRRARRVTAGRASR